MRYVLKSILTAFAAMACATAFPAFAQNAFGSASFLTQRNCNGLANAIDCLGTANPDIRIKQSLYSGGASVETHSSMAPVLGGLAVSDITFGAVAFPTIKAGAWAGTDTRVNSNSTGYQSFTYTGATGAAFSLTAAFDFTSSGAAQYLAASDPNASNEFGGEGLGFLTVQIMDAAYLPALVTAQDVFNFGFGGVCGNPGIIGQAFVNLSSATAGAASGAVTLSTACGGGAITLTNGQAFVTSMRLQTPTNRLGFFDATHTVVLRLGDNLSTAEKSVLQAGLVSAISAVPEPGSWSLLMAGFSVAGLSLRARRKGKVLAIA